MDFQQFCEDLKREIEDAYSGEVSLTKAEKLAARFLHAQMIVSDQLRTIDLDARMRKSGLKAIKSAVYLEHASKSEKKPSDVMLNAIVDSDKLVMTEQEAFDNAEVTKNQIENYLSIFNNAHIYFRGMAKQSFGG